MTAVHQAPAADGRDEIVVDGVTKRFDQLAVVRDVTLRIPRGEFFSMLGPSGCGKTTTLRMIAGFEHPTEGRIWLGGADVTGTPPARRNVNMVFQAYALFPHMTVSENVEVGAVARGHDLLHLPAILERTGLTADADRLAGTLAYGQQRRVEIARALAGRPRLLLLDEPAAGMNESESDALLTSIQAVREHDGCTIVIVDHDLRLMMRLCDRIHVLAEGRTIAEGPPAHVQSDAAVIDAYLGREG